MATSAWKEAREKGAAEGEPSHQLPTTATRPPWENSFSEGELGKRVGSEAIRMEPRPRLVHRLEGPGKHVNFHITLVNGQIDKIATPNLDFICITQDTTYRTLQNQKVRLPWLVWLSRLSAGLQTKGSTGYMPGLQAKSGPQWRSCDRQLHTDVSLPFFLPLK